MLHEFTRLHLLVDLTEAGEGDPAAERDIQLVNDFIAQSNDPSYMISTSDVAALAPAFSRHFELNMLSRIQLLTLMHYLGFGSSILNLLLPNWVLVRWLRYQNSQIRSDDKDIFFEGIENLTPEAVEESCVVRGRSST